MMLVVSNKANDDFSAEGLASYLRKNGVTPLELASPQETVLAHAAMLLQLLDTPGFSKPPSVPQLRHQFIQNAVDAKWLGALFPAMQESYEQQPLDYGRNSRYGDKWRISCYLVVMENWKPKIEAHGPMVQCMGPVMNECVRLYKRWHCRRAGLASIEIDVMNAFVTRYRPINGENELQKHIDGAQVDGSVILALPTDAPFVGGALHVWDGRPELEVAYQMKAGDVIFLEGGVWHQAKPITSGVRWALVLFLRFSGARSKARLPPVAGSGKERGK